MRRTTKAGPIGGAAVGKRDRVTLVLPRRDRVAAGRIGDQPEFEQAFPEDLQCSAVDGFRAAGVGMAGQ